jgi:PAT family acetyl-CoA transporter-like MFS transporter 1
MLFVSQCAFFARICDESIGGTYMTLLNTIANLGGTWPKFFVLYLADLLTIKDLDSISQLSFVYSAFGIGKIDGFYLVGIICVVFGAVWYYLNSSKLIKLQGSNVLVWRVRGEDVNTKAK